MNIRRPEDIGALVRERRRRLGLTQAGLASRIGVSQRYVSHLEGGKRTLQLGLVLRVLEELGVALMVAPDAPHSGGKAPRPRAARPAISIDELVDD